jgi:hypothetical protein
MSKHDSAEILRSQLLSDVTNPDATPERQARIALLRQNSMHMNTGGNTDSLHSPGGKVGGRDLVGLHLAAQYLDDALHSRPLRLTPLSRTQRKIHQFLFNNKLYKSWFRLCALMYLVFYMFESKVALRQSNSCSEPCCRRAVCPRSFSPSPAAPDLAHVVPSTP